MSRRKCWRGPGDYTWSARLFIENNACVYEWRKRERTCIRMNNLSQQFRLLDVQLTLKRPAHNELSERNLSEINQREYYNTNIYIYVINAWGIVACKAKFMYLLHLCSVFIMNTLMAETIVCGEQQLQPESSLNRVLRELYQLRVMANFVSAEFIRIKKV